MKIPFITIFFIFLLGAGLLSSCSMTHYPMYSYNRIRNDTYVWPRPSDEFPSYSYQCADEGTIPGWTMVDYAWDPNRCGNPKHKKFANVWKIAQSGGKAIGSQMSICSSSHIPTGWRTIGKRWDPQRCGLPQEYSENIRIIRRVH